MQLAEVGREQLEFVLGHVQRSELLELTELVRQLRDHVVAHLDDLEVGASAYTTTTHDRTTQR